MSEDTAAALLAPWTRVAPADADTVAVQTVSCASGGAG